MSLRSPVPTTAACPDAVAAARTACERRVAAPPIEAEAAAMPCRAHLPRQHASAARRRGLAMRIGKRSPRREDMCQATAGARALGLVTGSPPRQDLAPMARARRWPQRRAARLVRRRGRSGLGQERTSAIRARTDWRVALRGAVTVGPILGFNGSRRGQKTCRREI